MDGADGEQRETMYAYAANATYLGSRHQPCRFRTSLCPHQCGHATDVYRFHLDQLTATKNEASSHVRWVTPEEAGKEHLVGEADLNSYIELAKSLKPGDMVALEWSHDYVTRGGSSFPDRPVTRLVVAAAAAASVGDQTAAGDQAAYNFGPASSLIPLVYGLEAPGTPGKAGSPYAAQEPSTICNVVVTEWAAMLRLAGIARTLCLLTPDELACYSPPGYASLVEQQGLRPACESVYADGAWDRICAVLAAAEAAGEKVAVHCSAGAGRTGLVLAAFLVAHKGLSAEQAVREVRDAAAAASVTRKCEVDKVEAFLARGRG